MNRVEHHDKALPAKGVTGFGAGRARRGNVHIWHAGCCVRQGRRDQRSLFVENFVAVAMRPMDLAHAAVNHGSGKH